MPSPAGKPIAELRYEAPVTKVKTPRGINKVERPSHSASVQQRVALSTVSMQNNNKTENSGESKIPDSNPKKVGNKNERDFAVGNHLKMERSRTTISGRDWRKGKYSNNAQHKNDTETKTLSKSHDILEQVRKERSRPNTNDKDPNIPNLLQQNRDSRKTKIVDETNNSKQELQIISKDRDSLKLTSASNFREKSSKGQGRGSLDLTKNRDERKAFRDANLPKPSLPSQKYLEGQAVQSPESWGQRSMISPKSSKESLETEWLAQVKRYGVCLCVLASTWCILCRSVFVTSL